MKLQEFKLTFGYIEEFVSMLSDLIAAMLDLTSEHMKDTFIGMKEATATFADKNRTIKLATKAVDGRLTQLNELIPTMEVTPLNVTQANQLTDTLDTYQTPAIRNILKSCDSLMISKIERKLLKLGCESYTDGVSVMRTIFEIYNKSVADVALQVDIPQAV